jgi:preprotein translocase subunit Sec63
MGSKYSYDETGVTFLYFLLSMLALYLIPATWIELRAFWKAKNAHNPETCRCEICMEKRKKLKIFNVSKKKWYEAIKMRYVMYMC